MLANNRILMSALMLLPLAGGCGSHFAGEWVQESVLLRNGTLEPLAGGRRLALQFTPPSNVRVGSYSDAAAVVEDDTVVSTDYQTIQDRNVALFGAYTARVENGQLIAYIGAREVGRFRRLNGPSIFPPLVRIPPLVRATPSTPDEFLAPASPASSPPAAADAVASAVAVAK
jgi:hypothetical protein